MKEFLDKLSSYNLFNYLLPGILFAAIGERITSYSFLEKDIVVGVFVYYFIGLVISRIGSLIIEPFFRIIKFVKFAPYPDFVKVSQTDMKLELLSETNNMYRTLCALFTVLVCLKLYENFESSHPNLFLHSPTLVLFLLLALFCFSYRKQTVYVTKRIDAAMEDKENASASPQDTNKQE